MGCGSGKTEAKLPGELKTLYFCLRMCWSSFQVKMDEAKEEWMKMVSEKESTTKETDENVIQ